MRLRSVIEISVVVAAVAGSAALWLYPQYGNSTGAAGQPVGSVEVDSGPYSELLGSRSRLFRALDRSGYPEQCRVKMMTVDSLLADAPRVERWSVLGTNPEHPQRRLAIWLVRVGSARGIDVKIAFLFGWDGGGSFCQVESRDNTARPGVTGKWW